MARSKEFDKDVVLEKAKQLFWQQGFHATSVQNLVDHLGINRASIYGTFGGKNKLYEAALQSYRAENLIFLKEHLAKFDSVKKSLSFLFKAAIGAAIKDKNRKGCFVINCTTEYLPKHHHIISELLDNKNTFQNLIVETLERGKASGEFSTQLEVKATAAYLFSLFSGLQITAKIAPAQEELFKSIDLGLSTLN